MSLTKRIPIRSSRSSWTTGKQLCPDVRTARAMSSACTGMVRAVTSTRGCHDLAHVHVPQIGQCVEDDALLFGRRVAGLGAGGPSPCVALGRPAPGPTGPTGWGGWRRRFFRGRHAVPDQLCRFAARRELGSGTHQHGHGREGVVEVGAVVEQGHARPAADGGGRAA